MLLYVTAESAEAAAAIGRALVAERLAACVNILPGITSIYRWEGEVRESAEAILIVKTLPEREAAARARIRDLHSYEVPCILTLPGGEGDADFQAWVAASAGP